MMCLYLTQMTVNAGEGDAPLKRPLPCSSTLTLRHIEAEGVGYNSGYSTFEGLFYPVRTSNYLWTFVDLRLHYFNDNEYAANGGVGFRVVSNYSPLVWGINAYYDYRHAHHFSFNQIGLGGKVLGERFDFRFNVYMPVRNRHLISCCTSIDEEFYLTRKKYEVALTGANFEAGAFIKKFKRADLFGAIGPYYFGGDVCRHAFGGKLRLNARIQRYVSIEGSVSYDGLYKTRVQGIFALHLPLHCFFSKKLKNNRNRSFSGEMQDTNHPMRGVRHAVVEAGKHPEESSGCPPRNNALNRSVDRNEIIVLDKNCKSKWNF